MPGLVSARVANPKITKARIVASIALLALCGIAISCGSSKSPITTTPIPNIGGAWEFVAVSQNGSITGIEVALQEGQTLVNGINQPDGLITAASSQIAFVDLDTVSQNLNATGFGGLCAPTATPTNSLGPSTVNAVNGPMNFTFMENGVAFSVTGTLSGDGLSLLDGTYAPQVANSCANVGGAVTDPGGTITGAVVPKLFGTYIGQMCPLSISTTAPYSASNPSPPLNDCSLTPNDSVSAVLSESSSGTLTISMTLTGYNGTNLTLSGPVTGNAFSVSGIFGPGPLGAEQIRFSGYYEVTGKSTVATLYLLNATDPCYANSTCTPIVFTAPTASN